MTIGKKMRKFRNAKGYTLKQLSEICGLSVSFISDIENSRRNPSIENLNKLAAALDVSVNDFFNKDTSIKEKTTNKSNKKNKSELETIAAHLEGKNITPQKMKLLEKYIDALFDDE